MPKAITLTGLRMGAENPASENCLALGGEVEIREGDGGQYGVCVFPNGSECEEWSLYRKECEPLVDAVPLDPGPVGGSCAAQGAHEVVIGDMTYCIYPTALHGDDCGSGDYVKAIYQGEECCVPPEVVAAGLATPVYSKLLNYGLSMGAGALVGLVVAVSKSKKGSVRAAGLGIGAAVGAILLAITWPKAKGA